MAMIQEFDLELIRCDSCGDVCGGLPTSEEAAKEALRLGWVTVGNPAFWLCRGCLVKALGDGDSDGGTWEPAHTPGLVWLFVGGAAFWILVAVLLGSW